MKILGISFGRKLHNCDIVTIHALMAAFAAGADVKFINTMDMEIGHCTGCGVCSALRDKGKQIRCILKDDYLTLENEILDADGVIVAAPVYSIAPTGQLKTILTVLVRPMTGRLLWQNRRNVLRMAVRNC